MWRRLMMAMIVVGVTGWWLGGFLDITQNGTNINRYPVAFDNAPWLAVGGPDSPGYFRLQFTVAAAPDQATLWIEADQDYEAQIDGQQIGSAKDSHLGGNIAAHAVDVTGRLNVGTNVLAVRVINHDGRSPAFHARLVVDQGAGSFDVTTSTGGWQATDDITKVSPSAGFGEIRWSTTTFDSGRWGQPAVVPNRRPDGLSLIPQAVIDRAPDGLVVGAPGGADEMVAATTIHVQQPPSDGWIRVGASGPFAIYLNGSVVATASVFNPVGAGGGIERLRYFNIGPLLATGENVIAIHVISTASAAAYVDGVIDTGDGKTVGIGTGQLWTAAGPPFVGPPLTPPATQAATLGTLHDAWPTGVSSVSQPGKLATANGGFASIALVVVLVMLAWLAAGLLGGVIGGGGLISALGVVGLAHLPVLTSLAALNQVSRLSNVPPPFPHTYWVVAILIGAIALADLLALITLSGGVGFLRRVADAIRRAIDLSRRRLVMAKPGVRRHRRGPGADLAARRFRLYRPRFLPSRRQAAAALAVQWPAAVIVSVAVIMGALLLYRLDYDGAWQDEATSVLVADQIRAHGIPLLPSGLLYWKGELYHYIIAFVGIFTGDGVVPLRTVSVIWFVLTVLAFGFLLLPALFGPKAWPRTAMLILFVTAPMELAWARDIRMYQQAQFFAIVFVVVFLRALTRPTTRAIAGSMALLVALYLSHEESFIVLPAVAATLLAVQRLRWLRDWRWLAFGGGATAIIALQFVLANFTHPAILGVDLSNKPYVSFDPSDIWWYLRNIYLPPGANGNLALITTLSLLGLAVGIRRRLWIRLYLGAFVWLPVIVLSILFSAKSGRYTFITLPFLFVLAGLGALDILEFAQRVLTSTAGRVRDRRLSIGATRIAAVIGSLWLILSVTQGVRSYGLAVSRLTGTPYAHVRVNYAALYSYYQAHARPGDQLLAAAPPIIFTYNTGREPDYILSRSKNRLLYVIEHQHRAVDTDYGRPLLLTATDLRRVLNSHTRIWLFANPASLAALSPDTEQLVTRSFAPKAQSESGTLYFWQG